MLNHAHHHSNHNTSQAAAPAVVATSARRVPQSHLHSQQQAGVIHGKQTTLLHSQQHQQQQHQQHHIQQSQQQRFRQKAAHSVHNDASFDNKYDIRQQSQQPPQQHYYADIMPSQPLQPSQNVSFDESALNQSYGQESNPDSPSPNSNSMLPPHQLPTAQRAHSLQPSSTTNNKRSNKRVIQISVKPPNPPQQLPSITQPNSTISRKTSNTFDSKANTPKTQLATNGAPQAISPGRRPPAAITTVKANQFHHQQQQQQQQQYHNSNGIVKTRQNTIDMKEQGKSNRSGGQAVQIRRMSLRNSENQPLNQIRTSKEVVKKIVETEPSPGYDSHNSSTYEESDNNLNGAQQPSYSPKFNDASPQSSSPSPSSQSSSNQQPHVGALGMFRINKLPPTNNKNSPKSSSIPPPIEDMQANHISLPTPNNSANNGQKKIPSTRTQHSKSVQHQNTLGLQQTTSVLAEMQILDRLPSHKDSLEEQIQQPNNMSNSSSNSNSSSHSDQNKANQCVSPPSEDRSERALSHKQQTAHNSPQATPPLPEDPMPSSFNTTKAAKFPNNNTNNVALGELHETAKSEDFQSTAKQTEDQMQSTERSPPGDSGQTQNYSGVSEDVSDSADVSVEGNLTDHSKQRHPAFALHQICAGTNQTVKNENSKRINLCGLVDYGNQLQRLCNLFQQIEQQQQQQQHSAHFLETPTFLTALSEECHAFLEVIRIEKHLENLLNLIKEEKAKKTIKQSMVFERISVVFIAQNLLNKDVFLSNFKYLKGILSYALNNYFSTITILHHKILRKAATASPTNQQNTEQQQQQQQQKTTTATTSLSADESKFIQLVRNITNNGQLSSMPIKIRQKHVIQLLNQIRQNNEISISSFKTLAKNDKEFYSYILMFLKNIERTPSINDMFFSILSYLSLYLTLRVHSSEAPAFVSLPFLQTSPAPYLPEETEGNRPYTLVLDLDETLIHYSEAYGNTKQFAVRPYVQSFLQQASEFYEIVVFTAGMPDYANWVINTFDTRNLVKHRLYRQNTIQVQNTYIKDLSRIGRDLSKVIIIDNLAENFQLQPDNGIFIREWTGDPTDTALAELLPLLKEIAVKKSVDVRLALKSLKEQIQANIENGAEYPHLNLKL